MSDPGIYNISSKVKTEEEATVSNSFYSLPQGIPFFNRGSHFNSRIDFGGFSHKGNGC